MDDFDWEECFKDDVADDSGVVDKHGQPILKGMFVWFSKENSGLPVGPYRSEGYRYGSAVWSKPGIDFVACVFVPEFLEILPWKRWRDPKGEVERFLRFERKGE